MGFWRSLINQWTELNSPKSKHSEFMRVFDTRRGKLEVRFGHAGDLYSPNPGFQFGGEAAVGTYASYKENSVLYVTEELTGYPGIIDQAAGFHSGYELAILQPAEEVENPLAGWWVLSQFARSTLYEEFGPGHTSDIRSKDGPPIDGLIFTTLPERGASFEMDGRTYGILLAIGIKADELEFANREGSDALLQRLQDRGVTPYTIVNRPSVAS